MWPSVWLHTLLFFNAFIWSSSLHCQSAWLELILISGPAIWYLSYTGTRCVSVLFLTVRLEYTLEQPLIWIAKYYVGARRVFFFFHLFPLKIRHSLRIEWNLPPFKLYSCLPLCAHWGGGLLLRGSTCLFVWAENRRGSEKKQSLPQSQLWCQTDLWKKKNLTGIWTWNGVLLCQRIASWCVSAVLRLYRLAQHRDVVFF